jgi:energy-coupling factor transporter ATP-binding protein EcfA2
VPETYNKARFWKCALQVNPQSYESYRGQLNGLTEEEYNQRLLDICREQEIKVVGIANHGNVDEIDAIRKLLSDGDIVVFPGFEIESSEKIHFVCLFPEDTPTSTLNVYLGGCGIEPMHGTQPSSKGANEILDYLTGKGGVLYAAHCTQTNGILSGTNRYNHIWKNRNLVATQIPGSIEDLKGATEGDKFYQIVTNKNLDYKRKHPIAVLNAKDVEQPETLCESTASCLIKMTIPCFNSFKQAFYDPESRIRLNSDRTTQWYSVIEKIAITGGYLNGLSIELSEHLNAIIGGRGAGKSTLIECLRYALGLEPLASDAKKAFDSIIRENLGKGKGCIEVSIRSAAMQGRRFLISRRHGELPIVKDEKGAISSFSPHDLLPNIEIYGQNEIYEITQNPPEQHKLLARFLREEPKTATNQQLEKLSLDLRQNMEQISSALNELEDAEQEVMKMPKLQEQLRQFSELKLEEKIKGVPL